MELIQPNPIRVERYAPCLGCNAALDGWEPEKAQMCQACWDSMSPAEHATFLQTSQMLVALKSISGRQMVYDRDQESTYTALGGIGKSHERFMRLAKQVADELDSQMGRIESTLRAVKKIIERETGGDDDDEDWRESLGDGK